MEGDEGVRVEIDLKIRKNDFKCLFSINKMKNFNLEILIDLIAMVFFFAENDYGRESSNEETA